MFSRAVFMVALLVCAHGLAQEGLAPLEMRIYDVRALTNTHTYHPGPEGMPREVLYHNLTPRLSSELTTTPTFTSIAEAIRTRVHPETWDEAAIGTSIQEHYGMLFITQRPAIHQQIGALLKTLDDDENLSVLVKALVVETTNISEATFLDSTALSKLLSHKGVVKAQLRLVCYNTQDAYICSVNNHAYIRGYDIIGDLPEPTVETGFKGYALEAQPVLSDDRKSAMLEYRFELGANRASETSEITQQVQQPAEKKNPGMRIPIDNTTFETRVLSANLRIPVGQWAVAGAISHTSNDKGKQALLLLAVEPLPQSTPIKSAAPLVEVLPTRGPANNTALLELRSYDLRDFTVSPMDSSVFPPDDSFMRCYDFGRTLSGIAGFIKNSMFESEFADPTTSIEELNGRLVVCQRPDVQARIKNVLHALREIFLPQIDIRLAIVPASDVPENAYWDQAAFEQLLAKNETATQSKIVCCNAQRIGVMDGKQMSFVANYTTDGETYEPVDGIAVDGLRFDVRPTLSTDRSMVNFDLLITQSANLKLKLRTIDTLTADNTETQAPPLTANGGSTVQHKQRHNTAAHLEMRLPSAEVGKLDTSFAAPEGQWALAAVLPNPDPKAKEKNLLFFVRADALDGKKMVAFPLPAAPALIPVQEPDPVQEPIQENVPAKHMKTSLDGRPIN